MSNENSVLNPNPSNGNSPNSKKKVEKKKDLPIKIEDITKGYKSLTPEQIAIALTTPDLAPHMMSVVAKLNDSQLRAAVPIMTEDQVKLMVPKLQLEKNGLAFQVMSPEQVRTGINALTPDDRSILMQNISLLTSSSNKDELQSFISFVDPLAMAIAIQLPELLHRIIEAAGVMTAEQIKLCIPLLSCESIRDIMAILEHDSQIEAAISMIDRRDELVKLFGVDFSNLEKKRSELLPKLQSVKTQFQELEKRIKKLSSSDSKDSEYELICRAIKTTKSEIELIQQAIRELQASIKLPIQMLSTNKEQSELYSQYQSLSTQGKLLGKEALDCFTVLTGNDGLIGSLNKIWEQLKPAAASLKQEENISKQSPPSSPTQSRLETSDAIFTEEDRAVLLYEAIKHIGNPEAVGSHYPMTWNDIIQAGFRESKDFQERGIATLEQLQQYITARKK